MKKIIFIGIISCLLCNYSYAGVEVVKLLKAGPEMAMVEYKDQKIICRKYYPKKGEPLFGGSMDLGNLSPCIGKYVVALFDDKNGEILSLSCSGNKQMVLVVPDEFMKR